MEKERLQSKEKKTAPLEYRILIIYIIGLLFVAMFWASEQKSPWPLIYTLIIGFSLGALTAIAGIIVARRSS